MTTKQILTREYLSLQREIFNYEYVEAMEQTFLVYSIELNYNFKLLAIELAKSINNNIFNIKGLNSPL